MNAILLFAGAVLILAIGAACGYWTGIRGRDKTARQVGELQAELEDYRRQVSEHFESTAAHFQALGREYKSLYEHLASGACQLCEPTGAGKSIVFEPIAPPSLLTDSNSDAPVTEESATGAEFEEPAEAAPVTADDATDAGDSQSASTARESADIEVVADNSLVANDAESEKTIH